MSPSPVNSHGQAASTTAAADAEDGSNGQMELCQVRIHSVPTTWQIPNLRPFLFGGMAACVAEVATFPIDTAKTRLQLQGQTVVDLRHSSTKYRGMVHCWKKVACEEGFRVLYSGLAPALLRQAVYGTFKYGLYYTMKDVASRNLRYLNDGDESALVNVACAMASGALSSALATPTDVLKVRMQSRTLKECSSSGLPSEEIPKKRIRMTEAFKDIYLREGLNGLWRGVSPNAQRAATIAGVQLPVYDASKAFILKHRILADGAANHLVSSCCAGFCACLASSPIDVVRTRMMDQRMFKNRDGPDAKGLRPSDPKRQLSSCYRSSLECCLVTVRSEGLGALYRGFVPAFVRMGPWNVIFFMVYEELQHQYA